MWYWLLPVLVVIFLALLVLGYLLYQRVSFARATALHRQRIYRELSAVSEAFAKGSRPSAELVGELAARPELRGMLYAILKRYESLTLFPKRFTTLEEQARAELAFWLCHPFQSGAAPKEIEVLKRYDKQGPDGDQTYFVLRFVKGGKTPVTEWLLGVAGPYRENRPAYLPGPAAFTRFDSQSNTDPGGLLAWFQKTFASSKGAETKR